MRSLARWGALPLLAAPVGSWALGLNDIETISYLNQPLNAEISLTATPEELQSLRVSMAPVSLFTAAGLDYPAALNSIQFRIGRNAAGENVIFVTSRESISELSLTLVVQATHARGVSNKEYTLLLDPPLFRSAEAPREPIAPPATRTAEPAAVAGGNIVREQPAPQPAPQAAPQPSPAPQPRSESPPVRQPAPVDPAGYTVAAGDTLWSIAERYRTSDVTTNQAMIAIFEANSAAFDGNINRLRRGAILRIPEATALETTTASAANAEVRRQIDEWQAGAASSPRLVLIPPSEVAAGNAAAGGAAAPGGADESAGAEESESELRDDVSARDAALAEAAEAERLLQLRNAELADLQEQAAAGADAAEEPIFAEEAPGAAEAEAEAAAEAEAEETPVVEAEAPAAATRPAATPQADEPSLVSRIIDGIIGTVTQPLVWGGALAVVVIIALLAFLRRRRESLDDVTGQWEALEAEIDDDADRAATARMRAMAAEPDMVVVEGHDGDETAQVHALGATAEIERLDIGTEEINALTLPAEGSRGGGRRADAARRSEASLGDQTLTSQTLSSQTVINLDQADPIAEADFHMAYGLYDQAADLISKALSADPGNRAYKLKLLEVYFVWGNKESFLESALALKKEIKGGADWDKVVIMGKQICPDERLFSEATASAGEIDLDLEAGAGGAGLDFAFDEAEDDSIDLNLGDGGLSLEASGARARRSKSDDDMLEIGAQTQAGLEAALLEDFDERGAKTTPGSHIGDLDSTMESPTVETRGARNSDDTGNFAGLTLESPTVELSGPDAPTVETPTIESPAARSRDRGDTVEQRRPGSRRNPDLTAEMTAEIALDDLGLDVGDLKDMTGEVIELSGDDSADDDLLSATGVTNVLRDEPDLSFTGTEVLEDDEATMMAPGFGSDSTGIRTEVLEKPVGNFDPDLPATEDDLDLNLDDFSSALDGGADTVEQPMAARFRGIDLDVGSDIPADDEPTGTEEFSPLDPQTMTEVGTKLDLARAYIDMGDPEGAKSILEEVLSEGDAGQRSEAQALIAALPG